MQLFFKILLHLLNDLSEGNHYFAGNCRGLGGCGGGWGEVSYKHCLLTLLVNQNDSHSRKTLPSQLVNTCI